MTNITQTLGFLSLMALGIAAPGCSPSRVAAAPAPEQAAAAAATAQPASDPQAMANPAEAKISAPAQVSLTSSAKSGTVVVTLNITPQADIPRGVARIVLPAGVQLVSGQVQGELGALKKGVAIQHQVTVEIPSTGQFQIFAGVDLHITSGIRLHKAAQVLVLGQSSPAQDTP